MKLNYFTYGYVAICSICGAVTLLHLMIFLRRRTERVHLVFAFMALCCAISTLLDIQMHLATQVDAFVRALKATIAVQGLLWIAFAWFIKLYTLDRRRLPAVLVSGLYVCAIVLNLLFPDGILFNHIDKLNPVTLPWGETIAFGTGPANPWRLLPDVAWFILLAYTLDSAIRFQRQGEKRRAWFFGLSIFACLGIG